MQNWAFPNQACVIVPILPHQQSRHRFTKEEDEAMLKLINQFEDRELINWSRVASNMPNRTPRQCRERYLNYLAEKTKKGNWSKEEDDMIMNLYDRFGPKWAKMQSYFDGRSNIDIKNRYSALMRKNKFETFRNFNRSSESDNQQNESDFVNEQITNLSANHNNFPLLMPNNQIENFPDFYLSIIPKFNNPVYQIA